MRQQTLTTLLLSCLVVVFLPPASSAVGASNHVQKGEMAGYLFFPRERMYSCIEGGLGWGRDTRFATETPKFIMGGVALNFVAWANGPGAGRGRDWDEPSGKYGVAQLSPWVLWPPDGLNLKQGTCGELFGYGSLPLPLTEPKSSTAGKDVPIVTRQAAKDPL